MKRNALNLFHFFLLLSVLSWIPVVHAEPAPESNPTAPSTDKPAAEALPAAEDEAQPQIKPEVTITGQGTEYIVKAVYPHPMDIPADNYLEYIRMETLGGEFLGLATTNDKLQNPSAEFTVSTQFTKFDQFRLVAKSSKLGLIKTIHDLKITVQEPAVKPESLSANRPEPIESSKKERPRKKIFGLF